MGGHLDISPAIKHDVDGTEHCRISTTKLVLFYFHLIVANEQSQWKLEFCYSPFKTRKTGRATKANGVPEAVKSNTLKIKRKAAPSVAVKNRVKV